MTCSPGSSAMTLVLPSGSYVIFSHKLITYSDISSRSFFLSVAFPLLLLRPSIVPCVLRISPNSRLLHMASMHIFIGNILVTLTKDGGTLYNITIHKYCLYINCPPSLLPYSGRLFRHLHFMKRLILLIVRKIALEETPF